MQLGEKVTSVKESGLTVSPLACNVQKTHKCFCQFRGLRLRLGGRLIDQSDFRSYLIHTDHISPAFGRNSVEIRIWKSVF
jgi:hypothetical protein